MCLLIVVVPTLAAADECDDLNPGGTSWTLCKAGHDFEQADKSLNVAYQKATAELAVPERARLRKKLVESQRVWLSFRDKHCDFMHQLTGDPSDGAALACRAELTVQRTQFLESLLNDIRLR